MSDKEEQKGKWFGDKREYFLFEKYNK